MSQNCRIAFRCLIGSYSQLKFGNNVTTTSMMYCTMYEKACIDIGNDCMLGASVTIRTDDAHPIFDVNSGKRINFSSSVIIGDHVWLGESCVILKGVKIGNGSVVGTKSLVASGVFPNNCIIAGIPAKICRTNIAWERTYLGNETAFDESGVPKYINKEYWKNTIYEK